MVSIYTIHDDTRVENLYESKSFEIIVDYSTGISGYMKFYLVKRTDNILLIFQNTKIQSSQNYIIPFQ